MLLEEGLLGRGAPEGGPEGPVALPPQKERRRIYPQIRYDMIWTSSGAMRQHGRTPGGLLLLAAGDVLGRLEERLRCRQEEGV